MFALIEDCAGIYHPRLPSLFRPISPSPEVRGAPPRAHPGLARRTSSGHADGNAEWTRPWPADEVS